MRSALLVWMGIGVVAGACRGGVSAVNGRSLRDTIFVEDFESGNLSAWHDGVTNTQHRIVSDAAFAYSGRRFLEVTYTAGGDGGWLTHWFMPGYDSLFVSYYVRFEPEWSGGTKLIALYGSRTDDRWSAFGKAGSCPSGADFFAAMLVTEPLGDPGPTRFYTYYPAMGREPDGVTCWGRYGDRTERYVAPLPLPRGVWHHVEFRVRLNTPGQNDGSQTFWMDGVQRGRWDGLSFRSSDRLRLNSVQLAFNRGTAGGPTMQKLYVDRLVVTTSPHQSEPL